MVLCLKPPKPWPTQHLDVFFLFWRLQGFRFHHLLVSYQKMPMLSIAGLKIQNHTAINISAAKPRNRGQSLRMNIVIY